MALTLDVRLDGFSDPVGTLARDNNGAVSFSYGRVHLSLPNAQPVSLSLPLADEPYGDVLARAFFRNLLQERDSALTQVRAREGLAADDIVGLLAHVGMDCPGALSVLPEGAPPAKVPGDFETDYEPLSDEGLLAMLTSLKERGRLPDDADDPSPVAGVQSKIALTLLPSGQFAIPASGSGAPTTHIIKLPDHHPCTAPRFEAATLDLSRSQGFDTVDAVELDAGDFDVLLVRRFDRELRDDGKVHRLHQEDFAQALGLPQELKYERNGTRERRFDVGAITVVLDASADPVGARDRFIGATVFDLLTGNVDAHAKNHAVIHGSGGRVEIAPRYDLIPTRLDPELTDELAFKIGSAQTLEAITASDLFAFVEALGVATAGAQRRVVERHLTTVSSELSMRFDDLAGAGMKTYADLIAQNIRTLLDVVELPAPEAARGRDAFVVGAGGWSPE